MIAVPCKVAFDHTNLQFQVFRPPPTNTAAGPPGKFTYYGCYGKGQFLASSDHPTEFTDNYKDFLLSNTDAFTCVTASLRRAQFHQIVLNFNCRDAARQKFCETRSVAFLTKLVRSSDTRDEVEIYCLAKNGGTDRSGGLRVHVSNVYIAPVDYLVMLVYLHREIPELDTQTNNWCLPFASKSPDPSSIYYPYKMLVGGEQTNAVHGVKNFSRADLVEKFMNVLGPAKSKVVQFPTSVVYEHIDLVSEKSVPLFRSVAGDRYVRKKCSSLQPWNEKQEKSIFQQFCDQDADAKPCEEVSSFKWYTIVPRPERPAVCLGIREFSTDIHPLSIDEVRVFANRPATANAYKVCQALAIGYEKSAGLAIARCVGVPLDLFGAVFRQFNRDGANRSTNLIPKAALKALVVDVYADGEQFADLQDEGVDDHSIPRMWSLRTKFRFLSSLAIRQLAKGQATVHELAPFILPLITADDKGIMYFDEREWRVLKSQSNPVDSEDLVLNKLKCLVKCGEYFRDKQQPISSKRKRQADGEADERSNVYKQLLAWTMQYWAYYHPTDLPRCMFTFANGQVWDFALSVLHFPLMCFRCPNRSELSSIRYS